MILAEVVFRLGKARQMPYFVKDPTQIYFGFWRFMWNVTVWRSK